jgi:heme/copper-type cytochrome/quinol oxidase subunit 3
MEYVYGLIGLIVLVSVMVFAICGKSRKKVSPYLIFAIVDIAFGIFFLVFAIYDFHTAVGEFAGILGQLALMIGIPTVVILLIIDIIVWKVNKGRKE